MPDAATDLRRPNLLLRNDTILGVCEAIGNDVGFNPNWLRLLFAGAFFFNPALVVGSYLVLGLAVALSRWLAPVPVAASPAAPQFDKVQAVLSANDDEGSRSEPLAA